MIETLLKPQDFESASSDVLSNIVRPEANSVSLLRPMSSDLAAYMQRLENDDSMEATYRAYFEKAEADPMHMWTASMSAAGGVERRREHKIPTNNGEDIIIRTDLAVFGEGCEALFGSIADAANALIASTPHPVHFFPGDNQGDEGTLRFVPKAMVEHLRRVRSEDKGFYEFHSDGLNYLDPRETIFDAESQSEKLDGLAEGITPFTMLINFMGPKSRTVRAEFYHEANQAFRRGTAEADKAVAAAISIHGRDAVVRDAQQNEVLLVQRSNDRDKPELHVASVHAGPAEKGVVQEEPQRRLTLVQRGYINRTGSSQYDPKPFSWS